MNIFKLFSFSLAKKGAVVLPRAPPPPYGKNAIYDKNII